MKVGRFQVMAILQAARAKQLGLPVTEAESWGLNRAIFYAAAKRGFKGKPFPTRSPDEISKKPVERRRSAYFLGDEMAYSSKTGGKLYFTIGKTLQTESDYQRQIMKRFAPIYSKAWKEALQIVRQYPREILLSQNSFFQDVYKPRRDELAEKWTKMAEEV
jgi:hypothetical protein